MEKVRPWCGQPSDRGRLKIRSDQIYAHDKQPKYASNEKTHGVGIGMEEFGVLWVWGFYGIPMGFSVGIGMYTLSVL